MGAVRKSSGGEPTSSEKKRERRRVMQEEVAEETCRMNRMKEQSEPVMGGDGGDVGERALGKRAPGMRGGQEHGVGKRPSKEEGAMASKKARRPGGLTIREGQAIGGGDSAHPGAAVARKPSGKSKRKVAAEEGDGQNKPRRRKTAEAAGGGEQAVGKQCDQAAAFWLEYERNDDGEIVEKEFPVQLFIDPRKVCDIPPWERYYNHHSLNHENVDHIKAAMLSKFLKEKGKIWMKNPLVLAPIYNPVTHRPEIADRVHKDVFKPEDKDKYYYYPVNGQHTMAAVKESMFELWKMHLWPVRVVWFSDEDFHGYVQVSLNENTRHKMSKQRSQKAAFEDMREAWEKEGRSVAIQGNPSGKEVEKQKFFKFQKLILGKSPNDSHWSLAKKDLTLADKKYVAAVCNTLRQWMPLVTAGDDVFRKGMEFYEKWAEGKLLGGDGKTPLSRPDKYMLDKSPGLEAIPEMGSKGTAGETKMGWPDIFCWQCLADMTDAEKLSILDDILGLRGVFVQSAGGHLKRQYKPGVKDMVVTRKVDCVMLRLFHYILFLETEEDEAVTRYGSIFFQTEGQLLAEFGPRGLTKQVWVELRKHFQGAVEYVNTCKRTLPHEKESLDDAKRLYEDDKFPKSFEKSVWKWVRHAQKQVTVRGGNTLVEDCDRLYVIFNGENLEDNTVAVYPASSPTKASCAHGPSPAKHAVVARSKAACSSDPSGQAVACFDVAEEERFPRSMWEEGCMTSVVGPAYGETERNPSHLLRLLDNFCKACQTVFFFGKPHAFVVWELLRNGRNVVALENEARMIDYLVEFVKTRVEDRRNDCSFVLTTGERKWDAKRDMYWKLPGNKRTEVWDFLFQPGPPSQTDLEYMKDADGKWKGMKKLGAGQFKRKARDALVEHLSLMNPERSDRDVAAYAVQKLNELYAKKMLEFRAPFYTLETAPSRGIDWRMPPPPSGGQSPGRGGGGDDGDSGGGGGDGSQFAGKATGVTSSGEKASGGKGSSGKVSGGKGSGEKASGGKGSSGKDSSGKGSGGKGSGGKGSGGKGSGGKRRTSASPQYMETDPHCVGSRDSDMRDVATLRSDQMRVDSHLSARTLFPNAEESPSRRAQQRSPVLNTLLVEEGGRLQHTAAAPMRRDHSLIGTTSSFCLECGTPALRRTEVLVEGPPAGVLETGFGEYERHASEGVPLDVYSESAPTPGEEERSSGTRAVQREEETQRWQSRKVLETGGSEWEPHASEGASLDTNNESALQRKEDTQHWPAREVVKGLDAGVLVTGTSEEVQHSRSTVPTTREGVVKGGGEPVVEGGEVMVGIRMDPQRKDDDSSPSRCVEEQGDRASVHSTGREMVVHKAIKLGNDSAFTELVSDSGVAEVHNVESSMEGGEVAVSVKMDPERKDHDSPSTCCDEEQGDRASVLSTGREMVLHEVIDLPSDSAATELVSDTTVAEVQNVESSMDVGAVARQEDNFPQRAPDHGKICE
ncbi:hypothetical protein CBR_g48627 [Chara braunii]|uniref:Uncharacterized protein n=1 Tax=Chara braunii TaxID=69332 RepID=A0A388M359_CHABU|nr:hypothetical protein CBR_g48627 [Chara braunii]|eukprot:GBG89018.1 hypothetical protein CBR_g48627 [Chara braunii]